MPGMRIAIVTDAWEPQVNGVVQTLRKTRDELLSLGHEVLMITPNGRRSFPCPTYPEIRLVFFQGRSIRRAMREFDPDCIHIATEGPLGLSARRYCRKAYVPFTTAYHTQFPEYVRARAPIPIWLTVALLRWFHGKAARTMVPTRAIQKKLESRRFRNVVIWSRGVDTEMFTPDHPFDYALPRPIWIYMGRVAIEKNIEEFLSLPGPGSKVVIGDGPDKKRLERRYSDCHFLGYRFGNALASHLAGGDVFVFPSKTDTFGLVMLEAMACGLPVAALPVEGPIDVVRPGTTGILDDDLAAACAQAIDLDRDACRAFAMRRSWRRSTRQFERYLAPRARETASAQPASSESR